LPLFTSFILTPTRLEKGMLIIVENSIFIQKKRAPVLLAHMHKAVRAGNTVFIYPAQIPFGTLNNEKCISEDSIEAKRTTGL